MSMLCNGSQSAQLNTQLFKRPSDNIPNLALALPNPEEIYGDP